jgi:hypothetical protein
MYDNMDTKIKKIVDIFRKIRWLDNSRWESMPNDIGHCSINLSISPDKLTNSNKILTHFLCYISDRGMTYQQIWDKGGFVYSNIVSAYENENEKIERLINCGADDSFYKKIDDNGKSTKVRYGFVSRIKVPDGDNNPLMKDYGYDKNKTVTFTSRFYPSDLKSIVQTLMILDDNKFDRSIIRFVAYVMNELGGDKSINKIAFGFYLLGYYKIGRPKSTEYNKIMADAKENTKSVLDILKDKGEFKRMFENEWKSHKFDQKRVWCSLRDYVKSPEFKGYMSEGFKNIDKNELIDKWDNLDQSELELPGDVWNNKSKFKKCLFEDLIDFKKSEASPRFIRRVYKDFKVYEKNVGYPEMFDVTFDFVPRMCANNLCDFCIFNEDNKLGCLCTKDESKYCPVIMISCGYANKCKIKECPVVDYEGN